MPLHFTEFDQRQSQKVHDLGLRCCFLAVSGVQGQVVQCMRLQIACASLWFCQCYQYYDFQLLVPMILR